jgi:hypothetical protein
MAQCEYQSLTFQQPWARPIGCFNGKLLLGQHERILKGKELPQGS